MPLFDSIPKPILNHNRNHHRLLFSLDYSYIHIILVGFRFRSQNRSCSSLLQSRDGDGVWLTVERRDDNYYIETGSVLVRRVAKEGRKIEMEEHHHQPTPEAGAKGKGKGRVVGCQAQKFPKNPPDASNPDPATLREQWRFAIRQYSKWYSHAWGTAILAGLSFFALGWVIKGENPILPPAKAKDDDQN